MGKITGDENLSSGAISSPRARVGVGSNQGPSPICRTISCMGAAPPPGLMQPRSAPLVNAHAWAPVPAVSGPSVPMTAVPPPGVGTPIAYGGWASAYPNGDGGAPLA